LTTNWLSGLLGKVNKIGIFEAKTKLSELCTRVEESGAEYVITRRGRAVARILGMPKGPEEGSGLLARMAQLEAELGPLPETGEDFPDVWLERRGSKPSALDENEPGARSGSTS
jgi:prevent-host-death family protein